MTKFIKLGGKVLLITSLLLMGLVVLFFASRYIIYTKIKNAIVEELANLKVQGVDVTYDHLDVHPWSAKIEFLQLHVTVKKGQRSKGVDALVPYVLIKGVKIIPFLIDKNLTISEISVEHAELTFIDKNGLFSADNTKREIEINEINVGKISFPGIDLYLKHENNVDTIAHVLGHLDMRDIELRKELDSLAWKHGEVEVNDFAMKIFKSNYGVSVKKMLANLQNGNISIDSFHIQPTLDRHEFMLAAGKQTTYIAGSVPKLQLEDVAWFTYPELSLQVKSVKLEMVFNMFRDKRLPFRPEKKRQLPVQFVQKLPFKFSVDSITIRNSFMRYEEFPDGGDSSGMVYFEDLRATILNAHNNAKRKEDITMFAQAKFMGAGTLNSEFIFSCDTLKRSHAKGTLSNMSLSPLNNMIGSVAAVKVESGEMKSLQFEFSYTDNSSQGKVSLDYDNLKVLTLKNKNEEQAVSHLKTILINTIFIKKDVFNNISSDHRDGEISFVRDKERSTFNFWWKSVFSGVKSAFYLDKLPLPNKEKKEKKKGKIKSVLSKIF